jgi:hypothetical protein
MYSTFDNRKRNIAQRRFLFDTTIFNTCNSNQAGAKDGLKTDIEKSIKSKKRLWKNREKRPKNMEKLCIRKIIGTRKK